MQEHEFHCRKFRFEFLKFFIGRMVKNQHRPGKVGTLHTFSRQGLQQPHSALEKGFL